MTLTILNGTEAASDELFQAAAGAVRDLRRELEQLKQRVRAEGTLNKSDDTAAVKSAAHLLNICVDTENRIAKLREKEAGIVQNGHALDLDEARAEIGRKLDRLRNT